MHGYKRLDNNSNNKNNLKLHDYNYLDYCKIREIRTKKKK